MDVRNLFQLERTLHGDGVLDATTQEQGVMLWNERFRQALYGRIQFQGLLHIVRQVVQRVDQLGLCGLIEPVSSPEGGPTTLIAEIPRHG